MCGVTEVMLTLFTVLENSVASVGVASYYVMSRNVSISRCRAMGEAVRCWPVTAECRVASRASQCETSDSYNGKFYVIRTVRVLKSYYHPAHVACDAPIMTSTPTCFAIKVSRRVYHGVHLLDDMLAIQRLCDGLCT